MRPRALPGPSRRDDTAAHSSAAGHQQKTECLPIIYAQKAFPATGLFWVEDAPPIIVVTTLFVFRKSGSKRGREMTVTAPIKFLWLISYTGKFLTGYNPSSLYALRVKIKSYLRLARLEYGDSHDAAEARKWKPRGIRRFCNLCEAGEFICF